MVSRTELRERVGRNVKLSREALGLRPKDFRTRIGLSASALSNIEAGKNYPDPWKLVQACNEFGLTMDWFYRGIRAGLPEQLARAIQVAEAAMEITRAYGGDSEQKNPDIALTDAISEKKIAEPQPE